jgi:hypothetical protein
MKKYNHMLDIAFTVITTKADPAELTSRELREGLLARIAGLTDADLHEAIGFCDTYNFEEVEDGPSCDPKAKQAFGAMSDWKPRP